MAVDDLLTQEEALTATFKPAEAIIYSSFEVDEHYNLVIRVPILGQSLMANGVKELMAHHDIDLTEPVDYHVTICVFPLTTSKSSLDKVKDVCRKQGVLDLQINGLHLRPKGIVANVYSEDNDLASLRKQLSKAVGGDYRSRTTVPELGWITLGRFVEIPSLATCDLVRSIVKQEFYSFAGTPMLFKSNSRQHLGIPVW